MIKTWSRGILGSKVPARHSPVSVKSAFVALAAISAFFTTVRAQPPATTAAPTTAYLAAYFDRTENHGTIESLHYAVSRDGFHFVSLKDGKVVAASVLGDKKMRDPMILRDPKGGFHLAVTNSWQKRQFALFDSPDLIHWTGERLVVPGQNLNPTWAPELGYDAARGEYFVFWTASESDFDHACIYAMTSKDLKTWSQPRKFFQKIADGKNVAVMDASLFQANGKYHLVYRATSQIWQVTSSGGPEGPFDTDDHMIVDANGEGPFVYKLNDKDQWNLVFDYYKGNPGKWGVATSRDAKTWTLVTAPKWPFYQNGAASFPLGVRHGCVLAITETELDALIAAFGADTSALR